MLDFEAVNKQAGNDCQATKKEWQGKDTYKSIKKNTGYLGSTI